jgi:hypothetical protein
MSLTVGTLTVETSLTGAGLEAAADARITLQKGAANGVCELDSSALIPSNRLPSFVDEVLEFANLAAFPVTGVTGKIYVAIDTNKNYRWSGSVYVEISPSEVNSVFGRAGNVVAQTGDYTAAQVGADPSGSAAAAQAFAIQRANHTGTQTSATISDFENAVRGTDLVGVDTATTEIEVSAADTVLQAIGKLQGQINVWTELVTTAALNNSSNATLTNITELTLGVTAGKRYRVEGFLLFRTVAPTTGIGFTISLSGAVGTLAMTVSSLNGADGTGTTYSGAITSSGDLVVSNSVPAANIDYVLSFQGIFICTTGGNLIPQFRSEVNGNQVTVQAGSNMIAREF